MKDEFWNGLAFAEQFTARELKIFIQLRSGPRTIEQIVEERGKSYSTHHNVLNGLVKRGFVKKKRNGKVRSEYHLSAEVFKDETFAI